MISNHIRIGWRNLLRHRLYSGINIGGLALGLAVGILLLIWVQDELSFDRFHKNGGNIYRLSVNVASGNGKQTWLGVPAPIAPVALKEVPGVQAAVRMRDNWGSISKLSYQGKDFFDFNMAYVDPSFFTVFSFPLLKGNAQRPFPNNQSIVITRSAAIRYFGTADAVGKILLANGKDSYMVSGVMEDFPQHSSIRYDMLLPFDILIKGFVPNDYWKSLETDWGDFMYTTYLQLAPHTDINKLTRHLDRLRNEHTDRKDEGDNSYLAQPLRDIYLYNPDLSEGGIKIVRIFSIIAIVILLIACVNYVNLSTARAIQRAGEIGVRKMVGADRLQLFLQFLWESVLVFIIALALALAAIVAVIPFYNDLTGKQLSLSANNVQAVIAIGLSMLLTLVVAGIYPAVLLSSFDPLKTLKGRITMAGSNISLRKALVVLQFAIATVLIVSTLIVGQQLEYIRSKELGYDQENVFQFEVGNMGPHIASVQQELAATPGVLGVATANQDLLGIFSSTSDTDWDGKEKGKSLVVHALGMDQDFIKVMKLRLVSGRGFTGSKADSAHVIINETAARMMGMKDPVGKRFQLWQTNGTIIGVVKDFHFASLHEKINPVVFYYQPGSWKMYVRTTGKDAPGAIAAAEKCFNRYNAGYPFKYAFIDSSLDQLYKTDRRTGSLFNYFAGIAIFISCLGLFGLATFTITQRIKEIGIRKVLGASVANIVALLSADFLKIVLMAILVATPIAWYIMHRWLEDYAYRISIQWWVFLLAGGLAVLIALLTVSFKSVKAALTNPVKSLKTE